jgi:hypothetical protein
VRAQVRISAGEEISTQYVAPDKPTHIRRHRLRQEEFKSVLPDPGNLARHIGRLKAVSLDSAVKEKRAPLFNFNYVTHLAKWGVV